MSYSEEERDEIIREYFSTEGGESPSCPRCGETLQFQFDHQVRTGSEVRISCPDCRRRFSWCQTHLKQGWESLTLQYFLERHQLGQPLRCPIDDCFVGGTEYAEGVVEFRCPYCNRRGRAIPGEAAE